jgi:broad specificity phosphatase PhoE
MKFRNTYYLLRHGQTLYQLTPKEERIIYSFPEPKPILLTDYGKKQIKEVAEELKKENIDLIFSSPISRTKQTAEIVAKILGLNVEFDDRLKEINLGFYNSKPRIDYINEFLKKEGSFYKRVSGGESWEDVKNRVLDFINSIEKKYNKKKVLIISHGNPLAILEGVMRGFPDKELSWKHLGISPFKTAELKRIN